MAKTLITFIGDNKSGYDKAQYDIFPCDKLKLFAKALNNVHHFEKVIIFGTKQSMWHEFFDYFVGIDNDEQLYENLENFQSGQFSGDSNELFRQLSAKLTNGNCSKVYLLDSCQDYESIFKVISDKTITEYDELYIDITHSYRSIPMFVTQLVIYLRTIFSNSPNLIKKICYARIEDNTDSKANYKFGYEEDLTDSFLNINNWITGAYAFKEFGKGYQIAKLLGYDENDRSKNNPEGKVIKEFSDVMGMDFLYGIKNQVKKLSGIKNRNYEPIAKVFVPNVIENVCNDFKGLDIKEVDNSIKQFKIAKWHFEHMNYSSAIMDILESLISKIRSICSIAESDFELAKVLLGKVDKNRKYSDSQINKCSQSIEKYLSDKEYSTDSIVVFLNKILDSINRVLKNTSDEDLKKELIRIKPQINPKGKNAFSLVYSINEFRNAIAHQKELSFCSVDDIVMETKLCLDLLGKLI